MILFRTSMAIGLEPDQVQPQHANSTQKGLLAQPGTFLLWGNCANHWATVTSPVTGPVTLAHFTSHNPLWPSPALCPQSSTPAIIHLHQLHIQACFTHSSASGLVILHFFVFGPFFLHQIVSLVRQTDSPTSTYALDWANIVLGCLVAQTKQCFDSSTIVCANKARNLISILNTHFLFKTIKIFVWGQS